MNSLVPNGIVQLFFFPILTVLAKISSLLDYVIVIQGYVIVINSNINVRTEELLKKIMLAKTKHKKLWKFY
jgi:hypothetical protein